MIKIINLNISAALWLVKKTASSDVIPIFREAIQAAIAQILLLRLSWNGSLNLKPYITIQMTVRINPITGSRKIVMRDFSIMIVGLPMISTMAGIISGRLSYTRGRMIIGAMFRAIAKTK
jgi:hypothetical protein